MKTKRKKDDLTVHEGSGNVFADIGLPDADEYRWKAELVAALGDAIRAQGLTQAHIAEMLHIDQPKVSRLLRGQFDGFSISRLFRLFNALNHRVLIRVEPLGVVRRNLSEPLIKVERSVRERRRAIG